MRSPCSVKSGAQYSRDSVPVTGAKRVYGVPLEQLVIAGHSGVPRVVARLCHFIERHGMQTDGLFRTPGNQRSIAKIRADFDMYGDSNLERYKDVAAAAGCLKMFLRELPEAVVPTRFTEDFVAALREEGSPPRRCELLSALVHSLPPAHYALLRFLCSFLRRVTNFHSAVHMSADTLGIIFAPNVFRLSAREGGAPCLEQQAAINRILAQLIHNYDRIFNDLGQRHRPGSSEPPSGRERGDESDASAPSGDIQKRVDKSIQSAVTSHLLGSVHAGGIVDPRREAGDRNEEPPCKRLEGERFAEGRAASFESLGRTHHTSSRRSSHQPWPATPLQDCVRRANNHDDVTTNEREPAAVTWPPSVETEPITVPSSERSQGYDLPTPWSPVYTDEVIDESSPTSSSGSDCADTPPAIMQQIMCRHEQQRESERLATFPRSRDKAVRPSREVRRRRHSRGDGKDSSVSSSQPEDAEEEFEEEEELSDSEGIPPLDLDSMAGSEPIPSSVLKGRQLTEDEAILSPRNSFVLPDAEFTEQQAKLCSRFNERLPASPGASSPSEPRSHQLRQTIASAKRKIRAYEESFERRFGYRPSHADRAKDREVKRCLSELSKARRDLKALKQDPTPTPARPVERVDTTLAGKENRSPPEGEGEGEGERTLQQTVADVTRRLTEKRETAGRPTEPDRMSREQVLAEKLALQKALLCLEERHGRPAHKRDRDMVRPLYERYRLVKRLAIKSGSPKLRDSIGELTPILEHETMSFTAADRPAICERDDELEPSGGRSPGGVTDRLQLDDNLHNLPVSELRNLLGKAKEDKRRIRGLLLVFEEDFRSNVGRKVQKDDRGEMDDMYSEYKRAKAKVKLLEVLVAKHRSRAYTM
ncbi:protein FAM13A-like isoform X4 [Amphibalanus amphitrite]|uniref:protein FAM13A-like isoform X4 n=1 Tax=Amphibalanus amphitrite TaxID=1232801 RepID=UPI001C90C2B0|nr:protein FAM13A-like isoform X4 [Amphibalanus amphitrite]